MDYIIYIRVIFELRVSLKISTFHENSMLFPHEQEKFEQVKRELPQLVGTGCEVRVKGLGYSVQRAKGAADEPTVGDNAVSLLRSLVCLPLIDRLRKGKVGHLVKYVYHGTENHDT